jgi:U8 snoRNA-decapping enzyme
MTLRFDGAIGFPGGLIDPGESVVVALNRECREEIELDAKHILTEADFLCAMLCSRKTSRPLELHSFAKEVTEDEFKEIERRAFHAEDFGQEVMPCGIIVFNCREEGTIFTFQTLGIIRPPLYVQQNGRGLPSFLRNNFAGNAKAQFLYGLISAGILNKEEVEKCLQE